MGTVAEAGADLLERTPELDALSRAIDSAVHGNGRLVLVEGPAGIGKTRLLDACGAQAAERGMTVLAVRGDQLVVESSFAAMRELLWSSLSEGAFDGAARLAAPVFEAGAGERVGADRVAGVMHGLYWLVANLADARPLALLVDDEHWLDAPSARFLAYLARRVASLPVLLAVGIRGGEGGDQTAMLGAEAAALLRPAPLSENASAILVRDELGPRADEELCRSCHEATGGNPFYLRELTGALRAERARPTVALARKVRTLGAGAIGRSVLVRLARLGSDCQDVAEALAVLAPRSPLRHVAALAQLERERAERAADRLRAADLLAAGQALAFAHPIVREAVAAQMPQSRHAALHARAAALLAAENARADSVAAHLLSAEPYAETWIVDALRAAAREALAQGAPEAAVAYLRRALAEPPGRESRVDVLVELGAAEALLPAAQDFSALREAIELTADPRRRAEIAVELISALLSAVDNRSARLVAEDLLERADELDPVMRERLEGHLIGAGAPDLEAADRVLARAARHLERARRGEVREPVMLAALAMTGAVAGLPAAEVAAYARAAVRDDSLLQLPRVHVGATGALAWADELGAAAETQERGLAHAERRGVAPMFGQFSVFRSDTAYRAGELDEAEAHGRHAHELMLDDRLRPFALMWYLATMLERSGPSEAAALLEPLELSEPLLGLWHGVVCLAQRGRIKVALGDVEGGVADLLDADRRMSARRLQLSVLADWAPAAAAALSQLGRRDEARDLAERELSQAIACGAPRRHGMALSSSGLLDDGPDGPARLREAVAVLERSPARLEHARALVNLGIGLQRRGEAVESRGPLSEALDIAHRCGGTTLAEQARSELVAAGARPRRDLLSGPDALTPAEGRSARMAAEGLTNREIAQALFVSAKTVEWQLSHAYAKLGIRGRGELRAALRPRHSST